MKSFKKPLTKDEEAFLLLKSASGDISARNTLVEANLRLVAHIVKKYSASTKDIEDLISIGTIGLIKAINTYDINKGNRLAAYASRCIENELLMKFRQDKKLQNEIYMFDPVGTDKEGNEITLIDIIKCEDDQILSSIIDKENEKILLDAFPIVLSKREQTIIQLRYGLFGNDELTQREVASLLNISRSYVSRIEKKALDKLRLLFSS